MRMLHRLILVEKLKYFAPNAGNTDKSSVTIQQASQLADILHMNFATHALHTHLQIVLLQLWPHLGNKYI